jgi:hypothetical protein
LRKSSSESWSSTEETSVEERILMPPLLDVLASFGGSLLLLDGAAAAEEAAAGVDGLGVIGGVGRLSSSQSRIDETVMLAAEKGVCTLGLGRSGRPRRRWG